MRNKCWILFFIGCFFTSLSFAQEVKDTLSWNQFKSILLTQHPVAKSANLLGGLAKAKMKQAWGNFEPKISSNFDQKKFDGTNYYRFLTPEIKLPLWYGLELKGNYSEAEGAYLNQENKLPQDGLSYIGLNFSLGNGLLMDKRRAALKQAQIFKQSTSNQQLMIINDLILDAGISYLNWQNQYKITNIYDKALTLSELRYEAVKQGFINGDKPAIDTLEALTQIQQRQILLQQAQLDLQNATLEMAAYLWISNNVPFDLSNIQLIPKEEEIKFNNQIDGFVNNNPKLLSYNFKLQDLEVQKRLKAESLRPNIDLQLGLLNSGNNAFRNINTDYWINNNKIGLQFSFPLTFASARGELAEAKIKINTLRLEKNVVENELKMKLYQNNAERKTLQQQFNLLLQSVKANELLLKGEETKFKFGDSSLFLINSRELKLIDAQEKLLTIENKMIKNKLKADYIIGDFNN